MSILFRAYPLARSLLFSMDPERAHEVTLSALQRAYDFAPTRALMSTQAPDPIILMGLALPNPVGLAAGRGPVRPAADGGRAPRTSLAVPSTADLRRGSWIPVAPGAAAPPPQPA